MGGLNEMVGYDGLDILNRLDGLIGQDGLEELGQYNWMDLSK